MGQLGAELDFTSVDAIIQYGLHEYLDALQEKMNAIDASLREEFVARSPAVQSQSQSQSQGYGRQSQSQSQSNSGIGSRR